MKTWLLIILSAQLLLAEAFCSEAAAYSTPLSWLPMCMPGIIYTPTNNKLAVSYSMCTTPLTSLETNVATNGDAGAPGIANFDPAQPWAVLNGTVFSRRLGWNDPNYDYSTFSTSVLSAVQNVYGPGSYIWIDTITKSAGLNTYLAVGPDGVTFWTPPADLSITQGIPYSPIFGTLGSVTRWQWDGIMDHNTYNVPFNYLTMPNQSFSATYRLYIGDTAGNELLTDKNGTPISSASTETTWNWRGPAFVFTSQNVVPTGAVIESDVYTATGIVAPGTSNITVTGGEYTLSTDGGISWGVWTSLTGTITNTNKVKVRQTSAPGHGVMSVATLAIPGVPGTGEFRVTTTTVPDPVWPVKIQDGYDQPSLAYAYSIAPDMVEPNNSVIMIKNGPLPSETGFNSDRDITVTLRGGYNEDFSSANGITFIQGSSNVLTVKRGKLIVDKVFIRSSSAS